ncbi:MAG: YdcF family protein [Rhodococcus sp. (in: high G+C Gram-positive bacteria)]
MFQKDKTERRSRRRKRIGLGLVGFVAAAAAIGWEPYVSPQMEQPSQADAIVVLGGDHDGREEYALGLAEQGYAPQVVFSDPYTGRGVGPYSDGEYMTNLCNGTYDFTVTCFVPDPSTTRGEGREIRALAEEQNWQHVLVVTFRPHVSRSRYILNKCWDGNMTVLASPTEIPWWAWTWQYVYQTAGFTKAFFEEC